MTTKNKEDLDFNSKDDSSPQSKSVTETVEEVPETPEQEPEYEEAEVIAQLEEIVGTLQSRDYNAPQLAAAISAIGNAINSLRVVANPTLVYLP
jgi:hypothetical protein